MRAVWVIIMQPDPIMQLDNIVGLSGQRAGCVLWSAAGDEIVFPSNNVVIALSTAEVAVDDVTERASTSGAWIRH